MSAPRVALLLADLFEDSEALYPYYRFQEAGCIVETIGAGGPGRCTGKHGVQLTADKRADDVDPDSVHAVFIPGGYSPDKMRQDADLIHFVAEAHRQGAVVAAICHGPWMLASADLVRNRRVTSWPTVRVDLENAGANWIDEAVVVDAQIITSRKPDDLPHMLPEVLGAMGVNPPA